MKKINHLFQKIMHRQTAAEPQRVARVPSEMELQWFGGLRDLNLRPFPGRTRSGENSESSLIELTPITPPQTSVTPSASLPLIQQPQPPAITRQNSIDTPRFASESPKISEGADLSSRSLSLPRATVFDEKGKIQEYIASLPKSVTDGALLRARAALSLPALLLKNDNAKAMFFKSAEPEKIAAFLEKGLNVTVVEHIEIRASILEEAQSALSAAYAPQTK